jgi:hypothetical protein
LTARRPSLPRRLLAVLVLVVVLAGVLELASFALWWWSEGSAFSGSAAADRRRLLVADQEARRAAEEGAAERAAEAAEEPAEPQPGRPGFMWQEMLHPFLGFVIDPDLNLVPGRTNTNLGINNHGFYRPLDRLGDAPTLLGAPPAVAESGTFRVGVFGGSVGFIFSTTGAVPLARELARAGVVERAEDVEVVSYALGGYKQPQQLLTLAYMLALGERLDAVVNLDGFNDLTLALLENGRNRVYPYYPRSWHERVRAVPDPRLRLLQGEVAYLRQRRADLAAGFSDGPLDASVTANLVWLSLDRRAAEAVGEAEQRLAGYRTPRRRPAVSRGPDFRFDDRPRMLAGAVALWARSSRQMHDLCAARGIAYHHCLQPNQYVEGSKPLSRQERARAFDERSVFRPVVVDGYPLLQRAGAELAAGGVAFHDLTGVFAGVEDTLYFDDCCHFNRRGNALVAAAVAEAIAGGRPGGGAASAGVSPR